jgi:LmbE family N-acetylglucosaminyl deacetylase
VRAHEGVAVAIMTNGDLTCGQDGLRREAESVRALGELGLDAQHVYFLGYPDGYLARLGRVPLPPVERRIGGQCVQGNETYAAYGHDGRDVHAAWYGRSATYTADGVVTDLTTLLDALRPRDIVVTHPMDVHPDHAAAYAYLRRAMTRAGFSATVHRAMVHAGDCWPLGPEPGEPCPRTVIDPAAPFPTLFGALADYRYTERIPVPDDFLLPGVDANPKLRAIRSFESQLGPSPLETYLFTFSRREEPFFVESIVPCRTGEDAAPCPSYAGPIVGVTLRPDRSTQSVKQGLPLAVSFEASKAPPAIDFLADVDGDYELAYDATRNAALLSRREGESARLIKQWPLPHDLFAGSDRERFELRVEPRPHDGDVAELALYVRGALAGVAVDVHPRRAGSSLRAVFEPGAAPIDLAVRTSASAPPIAAASVLRRAPGSEPSIVKTSAR